MHAVNADYPEAFGAACDAALFADAAAVGDAAAGGLVSTADRLTGGSRAGLYMSSRRGGGRVDAASCQQLLRMIYSYDVCLKRLKTML